VSDSRKVKEFTVEEDFLPHGFFYEIGFSFETLAIDCLKRKFPNLSEEQTQLLYDENYDLFSETLYELKRVSSVVDDYCIGEEEIDEGTGTWGYFLFKVDDIDKAKLELEREIRPLFEKAIDDEIGNLNR
jgi:hypothetical protein